MENPIKTTRNSPLRKITKILPESFANLLVKIFPKITADQVTQVGGVLVGLGAVLKAIPEHLIGEDLRLWALGSMLVGTSLDAVDGPVFRKLHPDEESISGAMNDLMSDRYQESALALSRIIMAGTRRDPLGVLAAALSGITNSLPSLLRANVEKLGYPVPETGKNLITLFGTRPARSLINITSTTVPEINVPVINQSLQFVADTVSSIGNILTAVERASYLKQAKNGQLKVNFEEKYKELGLLKSKKLQKFFWANFVLMTSFAGLGLLSQSTK